MAWPERLRMMYSLRSRSSWLTAPVPRAMNTCRISGSTAIVAGESPLLSVGTSRQPKRI